MVTEKREFQYPKWLVVASTIVLIVGLVSMVAIIKVLENVSGWLYFAFLTVFYLPANIVVDMAGSVLWDGPSWALRVIPILLLSGFIGIVLYLG